LNKSLKAIRGMSDILPQHSSSWTRLERSIASVLNLYGYREIRLPIVEKSDVFQRSIGDQTDIVQKEMYSFADKNGDFLTLRPEGTAGCVRAVLENNLLQKIPQKLWYMGPMFRHERPQRGRQRQFHQVGVEFFGSSTPEADAELILLTKRIWKNLKIHNLRLEINSLGDAHSRKLYKEKLVSYFSGHLDKLDEESILRLQKNPLRILDSKNPSLKDIISGAPSLLDSLDEQSRLHFQKFQSILDTCGITAVVNPRLVRGLDYYNGTVFEWITEELGAQGTVCAGGRYDTLLEVMGGAAMPAIGLAMGLERLLELQNLQSPLDDTLTTDLYVCATENGLDIASLKWAERLRDAYPKLSIQLHTSEGKLKARLKKADRSGAKVAILIGEDELKADKVTVKPLRTRAEQITCGASELEEVLRHLLQNESLERGSHIDTE
jgi:histidyl-tRNA synthetase